MLFGASRRDLPAAEAAGRGSGRSVIAVRLTLEAEDRAFPEVRPFAVKDELFQRAETLPAPRSAGLFGPFPRLALSAGLSRRL